MNNKVKGNLIQLIGIPCMILLIILGIVFKTIWLPICGIVIFISFLCWGSRVHIRQEIPTTVRVQNNLGRPTWATIVGVLGIILGCFGILGGGQLIIMPKMMEFQKEMFAEMQKEFDRYKEDEKQDVPPVEMFKMFEKMWDFPDWYSRWCIALGIMALPISGFYLYAAICLLQLKRFAIKIFYLAVAISIGLALVKVTVSILAMSFMGINLLVGGIFSLVVNIVLLVVVATSNKEAFKQAEA